MRGVPAKPVAEGTPPSRMRRFAEAQRRHCDACDDGAVPEAKAPHRVHLVHAVTVSSAAMCEGVSGARARQPRRARPSASVSSTRVSGTTGVGFHWAPSRALPTTHWARNTGGPKRRLQGRTGLTRCGAFASGTASRTALRKAATACRQRAARRSSAFPPRPASPARPASIIISSSRFARDSHAPPLLLRPTRRRRGGPTHRAPARSSLFKSRLWRRRSRAPARPHARHSLLPRR
jgi:hypothetical protein